MSGSGVDSVTTSNCYCFGGASQIDAHFIVAVGKQLQWGDVPKGTLIVSFPISFSSAAYFCTGVEYDSGSVANNTFAPKTVSKTQVEFSNSGRAKKYIVAGK